MLEALDPGLRGKRAGARARRHRALRAAACTAPARWSTTVSCTCAAPASWCAGCSTTWG
jgi:hypothetical protein